MFAEELIRMLRHFDPKTLTKEDARLLPVGDGDEVIGDAPDELKILEATRRHFRDQFAKAARKFHNMMSSNFGLDFPRKKMIEQLRVLNERNREARAALAAFNLIENMYNLAIYELAVGLAGKTKVDDDAVKIYMRRGWKIVLRDTPDGRPGPFFPEAVENDPTERTELTTDTAPLPAGYEKILEGPGEPTEKPPPDKDGEGPDEPDDDGVSSGEE